MSDVLPVNPPDFISHCLFGDPWIEAQSISTLFGFEPKSGDRPRAPWCSKLEDLCAFFDIVRRNVRGRDVPLAESLCSAMVERNWSLKSLENLPISLATPIREVFKICQISPKMSYSLEVYKLIDREDLFEFARGIASGIEASNTEDDPSVSL
jgi:anaphase-promoting complex subunit 1